VGDNRFASPLRIEGVNFQGQANKDNRMDRNRTEPVAM
jgi:hypothetical protein